ncbi:purine/pyrimidine permease [Listeria ilorinensis]|uniref:purine/pyrimidine permease n=1 Tax=Listeria ilorinensis TaxID=2867439 RepID=UPI001EF7521A|nr:purine/pyrimidine permease [Listeria ilorinensis]
MKGITAGFQWMIFMIAAAIAAPIAISDLYHLSPAETALFMQRTIFVLGIAGFLQGVIGHKLPIHEGPAGLWWSVFTLYAGFVGVLYSTNIEALEALSFGMLFSGVLFILLAFFGIIEKLARLFTPTVTLIYLLLLVLQMSGSFLKGMLGITEAHPKMDPIVALLSLVVIILTFSFGRTKILWLRQYSVIFALILGWSLFIVCGKSISPALQEHIFSLPQIFAFGLPTFDWGSLTTAFFITFLLITNLVASVRLMENILFPGQPSEPKRYRRGGFVSGINQLLSGLFSAIGPVPISGAAGFVAQTGEKSRRPFLLGCILTALIAFFPPIMAVMATIPAAVGYAVTFVLFANMLIMALKELKKITTLEEERYLTIGIAILTGVGVMFLPADALSDLPAALLAVLNNGLIVGSVIGILIEQYFIFRKRRQDTKE